MLYRSFYTTEEQIHELFAKCVASALILESNLNVASDPARSNDWSWALTVSTRHLAGFVSWSTTTTRMHWTV